jgi:hypothetical protein
LLKNPGTEGFLLYEDSWFERCDGLRGFLI